MESVKKPWYKTWWGVLTLIIVWPISLSYFIWTRKWDKNIKFGLLTVMWVFVLVIGVIDLQQSKPEPSVKVSAQNQTQPIIPIASVTPSEPPKAPEVIKVDTAAFVEEFDQNQLAAEEKYKHKLVEFKAVIDNISEDILGTPFLSLKPTKEKYYLGTTIKCNFGNKAEVTSLKKGQEVNLQGSVNSQSLGIIIIDDCRII